jgi:Flp pilus assembly protein TadG
MTRFFRLKRAGRRLHRDERGQAALEFLLIFPIFVLFLLLLVDLGLMMYGQISTANAVREGARYASVNCSDGNCTAGTIATTPAERAADRSSGFLDAADIDVEWTGVNRGDSVVVRADRTHQYLFFPYSIQLQSCAQMRLEQRDNGTITASAGAEC